MSQDAFILANAIAVDPVAPEIKGATLMGFELWVLLKNHRTGADTKLLKMLGEFEGPGPN